MAAEGKYHDSCFKKFYKVPSIHKHGRPQNAALAEALKHLFYFLDNNDECQYPTEELLTKLEEYLPSSSNVCSEKTLRQKHGTYNDVYKAYISYVERPFHRNCYVVFDGYSDGPTTKNVEQSRRAKKVQSTEIFFTDEMPITMRQDRFLANGKTKARLINGLKVHLEQAGIRVKEAAADADTLGVQTTIELSQNKDVLVIGTDTDLLIFLIEPCHEDNCLYIFQPESGTQPNKVYNIRQAQHSLPAGSCSNLFFLHAVTG